MRESHSCQRRQICLVVDGSFVNLMEEKHHD
jgi:hypothetical protein